MKKLILVMILALIPAMAQAQTICATHEKITEKLRTIYKEEPLGVGLISNGHMVEIYVSETGTWSFIATRPDGLTCLMATGKDWQTFNLKFKNKNETDS